MQVRLPFSKDSLDSVVCLEAIEHVPDAERILREIARVLRSDGLLIISTPNKWTTYLRMGDPSTPTTSWTGIQEASRSWPRDTPRLRRYTANPAIRSRSRGRRYAAIRGHRVEGVNGRLRLLGLAQQLRKTGGYRSVAQKDSQHVSTEIDAPAQEEVPAAWPRFSTSTRQQGIPVTVILIARRSRADGHASQRSGWDAHQQ
jgi:SAM-dependent methyltransferase